MAPIKPVQNPYALKPNKKEKNTNRKNCCITYKFITDFVVDPRPQTLDPTPYNIMSLNLKPYALTLKVRNPRNSAP